MRFEIVIVMAIRFIALFIEYDCNYTTWLDLMNAMICENAMDGLQNNSANDKFLSITDFIGD